MGCKIEVVMYGMLEFVMNWVRQPQQQIVLLVLFKDSWVGCQCNGISEVVNTQNLAKLLYLML